MTYDADTDTCYTPGGARTGRTSLLDEYRDRCEAVGPSYAQWWIWTELVRRHRGHVYRLNRWIETIERILREAVPHSQVEELPADITPSISDTERSAKVGTRSGQPKYWGAL